jgi:hypothetical protein
VEISEQAAKEVAQTKESVELTNFATKQKARKSLLNAKRSGELEMIAQGMESAVGGTSSKGRQRRNKDPIDLQARNFNGVDIYSYFSDENTMPKYMKQGAKRSVPSKLRAAVLLAEEYSFLLGKRELSGTRDDPQFNDFFKRNPNFKF